MPSKLCYKLTSTNYTTSDFKFCLPTCLPYLPSLIPSYIPSVCLCVCVCACVYVCVCVCVCVRNTMLRLYDYDFWGFNEYIIVDLVKRSVQTLVREIQHYRNDHHHYHYYQLLYFSFCGRVWYAMLNSSGILKHAELKTQQWLLFKFLFTSIYTLQLS